MQEVVRAGNPLDSTHTHTHTHYVIILVFQNFLLGIGACSSALSRLGLDYGIVDAVEIDKYAIKSFNAIHGTNFEPQDITKWNKDVNVDLIMHRLNLSRLQLSWKTSWWR